jgi:hypothetical protein
MTTAAKGRSAREASTTPAEAFSRVTGAAVEYATYKMSDKVAGLVGKGAGALADEIPGGSTTQRAGMAGVTAAVRGENPVWAAIKSSWSGAAATVKAAIVAGVVAMVLLLVLSPVLLLAFLVSLLVIAAVEKVLATRR